MTDRFFIDERIGVIAVRDRHHPEYDPDRRNLHGGMPDVVWFEVGAEVPGDICPHCGKSGGTTWGLRKGYYKRAAQALLTAYAKEGNS